MALPGVYVAYIGSCILALGLLLTRYVVISRFIKNKKNRTWVRADAEGARFVAFITTQHGIIFHNGDRYASATKNLLNPHRIYQQAVADGTTIKDQQYPLS